LIFWNQFKITVCFNLKKPPLYELELPLNLVSHKIASTMHKMVPGEQFHQCCLDTWMLHW